MFESMKYSASRTCAHPTTSQKMKTKQMHLQNEQKKNSYGSACNLDNRLILWKKSFFQRNAKKKTLIEKKYNSIAIKNLIAFTFLCKQCSGKKKNICSRPFKEE